MKFDLLKQLHLIACWLGYHFPNVNAEMDHTKGYRMLKCQTCGTMQKEFFSKGGDNT